MKYKFIGTAKIKVGKLVNLKDVPEYSGKLSGEVYEAEVFIGKGKYGTMTYITKQVVENDTELFEPIGVNNERK